MRSILLLFLSLLATPQISWAADKKVPKGDPNELVQQPMVPFKLSGEGGILAMEIKGEGSLSINEKEVGTLSSDGILLGKDGKEIARLGPDGMVVVKDGRSLGKVHRNGEMELNPDTRFSWVKGNLKLGDDGPLIRLDPDKPQTRRLASFLLLLNFSIVAQEAKEP